MSFARFVRLLAFAVCVGVLAGCPGTDPLNSSFGNVDAEAGVISSSATRFDEASVSIQQILVRPADAASQLAAGSSPIGILDNSIVLTLENASSTLTIGDSRLPQGSYEVIGIRLSLLDAVDFSPPSSPTTCTENFARLPPDYSSIAVGPPIQATELVPTNAPALVVIDGGDNTLTVEFDFEVLAEALVDAFEPVCRETSSCSFGAGKVVSPPCIQIRQNWSFVNDGLVDAVRIATP